MCLIAFSLLASEGYTKRTANNARAGCGPDGRLRACTAVQKLWRKSSFGGERQRRSKDDELRGAGLRLDCSGTGTRLRAGAIVVFSLL